MNYGLLPTRGFTLREAFYLFINTQTICDLFCNIPKKIQSNLRRFLFLFFFFFFFFRFRP
jgi:hypothetical protein